MAKRLYVGNLSYQTAESALRQVFAEFGTLSDVTIVEGKGFGFVEFETDDAAQKAMNSLNGTQLDGRQIRVDVAQARTQRTGDGPRGGGGRDRDRGGRSRW
jgi:RNA recognition motif-containing protein